MTYPLPARSSIWHRSSRSGRASAARADEPAGAPSGTYDVAIAGAGLVGLSTAILLAEAGCRVAVLESRTVGAGTTGNSTAKISLLQGSRLSGIRSTHGAELTE
nr:FAD-dependent oxidoreductase [Serinibacter salmoneus]